MKVNVDKNDFDKESEKWDNRELGADEEFAKPAPDSVQEEFKNIMNK